jgi:AraC-like DNA-binding protein
MDLRVARGVEALRGRRAGYTGWRVPTAAVASRYTAATPLSWMLLAHLRELGIDVPAFVRGAGSRLQDLLNAELRVSLSTMHALWRAAATITRDDALGVSVVSRIDPTSTFSWPAPFSVHEHVGRAATSLRDGTIRQSRLMRLLRDGMTMSLEGPSERPTVRFDFALKDEPRELIHFHLASSILYSRRVLNTKEGGPLEVCFAEPRVRDERPFAEFFACPLRWDAEAYGIVADGKLFDEPIASANPTMLSVIESRAKQAVERLPALDDFVQIVCERIEAELPGGNTNASRVAEKLGMSQRTLHRRLQAESTSYQDLLDKVRCRLATRYLVSHKHSINEVAQLVGFAQPSAFHRAFKAWTGETPSDYQERLGGSQNSVPMSSPPRSR